MLRHRAQNQNHNQTDTDSSGQPQLQLQNQSEVELLTVLGPLAKTWGENPECRPTRDDDAANRGYGCRSNNFLVGLGKERDENELNEKQRNWKENQNA